MAHPLISVCVRTGPGVAIDSIKQQVVGRDGRLGPTRAPTTFWATTAMTIKQIQAIEGVKACVLTTGSW